MKKQNPVTTEKRVKFLLALKHHCMSGAKFSMTALRKEHGINSVLVSAIAKNGVIKKIAKNKYEWTSNILIEETAPLITKWIYQQMKKSKKKLKAKQPKEQKPLENKALKARSYESGVTGDIVETIFEALEVCKTYHIPEHLRKSFVKKYIAR